MADVPSWQDLAMDAYDAQQSDRAPRRSVALDLLHEQFIVVKRAARGRNMAASAFARRATVAVAHHDLGFDWVDLMASEQTIAPWGQNRNQWNAERHQGFGFGPWRILSMEDYRRDDN